MEKGSQGKTNKDGTFVPERSDFLAAVSENLAPTLPINKPNSSIIQRTLINGVPKYDGPDQYSKLSAEEFRRIEKSGIARMRSSKISQSEIARLVLKATGWF